VKLIQEHLEMTADGKFGPQTEQRIRLFQERNKLTADGVVGPVTWRALFG
jgi:peptidoglycan hydrolase-like protein with peptidoglycan-binding domain